MNHLSQVFLNHSHLEVVLDEFGLGVVLGVGTSGLVVEGEMVVTAHFLQFYILLGY